ncbi:MAG: DNA polymerase I [Bacteroides sp.]|nr:DNA polymerase I [Bacillota bacterium]MCM1393961.1 DNA polymerase I [[Eubacterium] siraeum]MCM1455130.1 DNA polymerase I [Bacteroides sp.]
MAKNKILLLDSNSLMHRAYHALPNLKSSKGQYTGAVFGFVSILLRLIKEQNPTHIAAAFDLKGPTFRHEMYDGYKATRKPMDEELRQQVEPLKELIAAMGIKIVSMQGYEGDDILGTLANRFGDECIIVTGDRDSFQLVSPTTRVFWTKRGVTDIEVYDEARLLQDGFTPSQFIDYKALMGDASDNIPGIAGVGEKTAKALLASYGSLDSVLAHAEEISGKVGQNVVNGKDMAILSRKLAVIKTDVPVECTLDDIKFTPIYSAEVKAKLMELEISSLINRMTFDESDPAPTVSKIEKNIVKLNSLDAIKAALKGDSVAVYVDREISFSLDGKTEYVIDCAEDLFSEGPYFDDALDCVRECAKDMRLICYDFKTLSKKYGFDNREFFDIMIGAHLARESMSIKSLAQVLGAEGMENGACEIYLASVKIAEQLTEKGLNRLFYDVELPLCVVLRDMELRGVRVSIDKLKQLEAKYGGIIEELSRRIYEKAGCTFNIASPKQLGEVLFEKLGLPHGKKTKTGYSVGEDVLANLAWANPIVKDILEYRHYTKLQSTYVVGLQPLINRGRIHTEFNQCITMTGRLSSTNPNLQNIPTRSEEAKDIKSAFLPSEGNVLVSADYSQIELRLLAHMSGDEQLIEAFNKDDDIHAITASQILGVPLSEVTPDQRRDAKAVNFGIIYGISGFGLAENLSIPQYKAKEFIANYFSTHPRVRAYMDGCVAEAREKGYAVTLLGRRRNLSDLNASNYLVRSSAERMAMNTPLQGSAADIIKLAMLGVEKRLKDKKSKMILQIHDELIIDTARDELDEVMTLLAEEMQNAIELKVPLIAKAGYADDWGALK